MSGLLIAGWFALMVGMLIITVWLRSSEKCLFDHLRMNEPEIFEELGQPTIHQQWPLARLDRDERALVGTRATGQHVGVALRDYEIAIKARRIAFVVVLLATAGLVVIA